MRFSILAVALTATAAFAQDQANATTTMPDIGNLPSQLSQLAGLLPTLPPNWELPASVKSLKDSLPTPPPGILTDLVDAVPTSVLRGLVNPASRSALQESAANGDVPDWYKDLPTPVKSYLGLFATQIADRSITYNPTAAVASPGSTVKASADSSSSGNDDGESGDASKDSDKENAAFSSYDSKAISTSVLAAMGILGVALAL
ncbi:uncharacterized protein APUU_21592S [Aspergillus puulaauensis]|uniref:Uncharacterized protein n=1 Tax=Aspergillus puulaauensis TaxID=1220207 RepID=A0A7R8AL03_9EURO|nr:uncharacterized protein APUU_21592S [Aspergillus puulaauensis]BCS21160.1 hypothetical protein APUU_21592S [Aspergillus puulaauensis]